MELRPEDIREILRIFAESTLEDLRLEVGGTRLAVSKTGSMSPARADVGGARPAAESADPPSAADLPAGPSAGAIPASAAGPAQSAPVAAGPADVSALNAPAAAEAAPDGLRELQSPLLGIFYRRPAPDQAPFVEVGTEVAADSPVCIVDVMKMFTSVPAGTAGRIAEICAEDGQLVERGQVLMRIAPR